MKLTTYSRLTRDQGYTGKAGLWTLGLWTPGRLDAWALDARTPGRLYSGRLDACECMNTWTLDAWTLNTWTLEPWTPGLWTLGRRKFLPFLVTSFLLLFRHFI